jgi:ribosomal protein L5
VRHEVTLRGTQAVEFINRLFRVRVFGVVEDQLNKRGWDE